jgi:hypothetical protein
MKAFASLALAVGVLLTVGFFVGPFAVSKQSSSHDFEFAMVSGVGLSAGIVLSAVGLFLLLRARQKKAEMR